MTGRTAVLGLLGAALALAEEMKYPAALEPVAPERWVAAAVSHDARTLWMGGIGGTLLRSNDGGRSWTRLRTAYGTINRLALGGDGRLFIAARGVDGLLIRSRDDSTHTRAGLGRALEHLSIDASGARAIIVDETGSAYTTADLRTWNQIPAGNRISSPAVSQSGSVMLVATAEELQLSTDGGSLLSWTTVAKGRYVAAAIAPDASFALAINDNERALMRSPDGGRTWTKLENSPHASVFSQLVATNEGGYILSSEVLYGSRDKGGTWQKLSLPPDFQYRAIAADPTGATIVAAGYGEVIALSRDHGKTFEVVHNPWDGHRPPLDALLVSPDGKFAVAAGQRGVMTWTRASDRWSRQPAEGMYAPIRIVFLPEGSRGWLMGRYGLVETTDQGRTWRRVVLPPDDRKPTLLDLAFDAKGTRGWLTGMGGYVFRTDDAGRSWAPLTTPLWEARLHINVVAVEPGDAAVWLCASDVTLRHDPRTGKGRGEDGPGFQPNNQVFRHDLRTGSFERVPAVEKEPLLRLKFLDDGAAVALSTSSFFRRAPQSVTWMQIPLPAGFEPHDMWFDEAGVTGWIAGKTRSGAPLLRTIDGGFHWTAVASVRGAVTQIAFSRDGLTGWALSEVGALHTSRPDEPPAIEQFAILPGAGGHRVSLQAKDAAQAPEALQATIEVDGPGLGGIEDKTSRTFALSRLAEVEPWPASLFASDGEYRFQLRLSDGWNVVGREFVLGRTAAAAADTAIEIPTALDLGSLEVEIGGRRFNAGSVLTRGGDGQVRANPAAEPLRGVPDGVFRGSINQAKTQFYAILDGGRLRLFRPFRKSYALLVAVGAYPDGSGYRLLPNAVAQARELEGVLRGQGFEVYKTLYDGAATRRAIEEALLGSPAGPEDRLFVYFGGHGDDVTAFGNQKFGFLVPYDGRQSDLRRTGLALEDLRGRFSKLMEAKQVLFALDSCQSGLVSTRGTVEEERLRALVDIEAMSREPGRLFLTAGRGAEPAIDVNGGIFTKALIDGIRGRADVPANGAVTFFELYEYIRSRVATEARLFNRQQNPDQELVMGRAGWVFVTDRTLPR